MKGKIVEFGRVRIHEKFVVDGVRYIRIPSASGDKRNAVPDGGGELRYFKPEDTVELPSEEKEEK